MATGKGSQNPQRYVPTPAPSIDGSTTPWSSSEFQKIAQALSATQDGFRVIVSDGLGIIKGAPSLNNIPKGEFRIFYNATLTPPGLQIAANINGVIFTSP